ncbi:MAG: protein kinase [Polyangiaceae bacterium]
MDLQPRSTGAELHPGAVIAGRYRVDARVGAGGMGAVWSGEHLAVGVKVALKQLLVSAAENHEVVARFKREAVFLGKIRSDHVARVLDFVTDETYGLVLVMEFIEGDPLSKILGARTLSVEETVDLGADIAAALVDLHRHHIVHRDLKPGNIIWQALVNGSHRAIIVDFGVSRILSQGVEEDEEMTGITRADMALGTIEYMAPEQILNSRDVTPASDIYALGAILFRAHVGRHVFGDLYDADLAKKKIWTDPPPIQTGRTDKLSRGLEAVVNRALTRSPKKRYAQSDEVLAELNMLRDLMKAAAFDIDTMTTRDNSAILEALAAAEAKEQGKPAVATAPVSSKEPPASAPTSAPAQSSNSLGAATASIPGEPPRIVKKGVSPVVAILGILVAAVGGIFLGTRLGPTAGGLLPGLAPPDTAVAATAPVAPEPTAAPSAEPTTTAVADAPDTAAAASADAPADSAAASADAADDKPKLYGKLPDPKPTSAATTTAPATTSAPPASAPKTTTTASAPAAPKTTTTAATAPKAPSPAPTIGKEPDL